MPESILNVRVLGKFFSVNICHLVLYTHANSHQRTSRKPKIGTPVHSYHENWRWIFIHNSRVPKRPPRKWDKSSSTTVESTCSQLEKQVSLHCNIGTQKQPPQVQKRNFSTLEFSKRNNKRKDGYPLAQDTSKVQRYKLELDYKGTNLNSFELLKNTWAQKICSWTC